MNITLILSSIVITFTFFALSPEANAWHDATHMAVAKAAGLDDYAHLAVGADMAKEKSGETEGKNHYNNLPKGMTVTPEMVLAQFGDYNNPRDDAGHLYGAIVASLNDYLIKRSGNKYSRYSLGYAAHYLGDLSMPFHNMTYNDFNKANHGANDGAVENTGPVDEPMGAKVARLAAEIQARMDTLPPLRLATDINGFYRDLAAQVASVANQAAALGYAMQEAKPPRTRMTEAEAYAQLALSARLLKAVYAATRPAGP